MPSQNQQQYYRAVQQAQRQQRPERQWFWVGRDDAGMGLIQDAGGNIIPAFVAGNAAIAPGMPVLYVPPQPWQQYGQVQLATVVTPQPVRPPERITRKFPVKFMFREPKENFLDPNVYWVCGPFEPVRVEFPTYEDALAIGRIESDLVFYSTGAGIDDWYAGIRISVRTALDPETIRSTLYWKRGTDASVTTVERTVIRVDDTSIINISGLFQGGYYFEFDDAERGPGEDFPTRMKMFQFENPGITRNNPAFVAAGTLGEFYGFYDENTIAPNTFINEAQSSDGRYTFGGFEGSVDQVIYDSQAMASKPIAENALSSNQGWAGLSFYGGITAQTIEDSAFVDVVFNEYSLTETPTEWVVSAPIQKQGQEIILPPQYDPNLVAGFFSYHP